MPTRAPTHKPPRPACKVHGYPEPSRQKRRALHTGSKAWERLRLIVLRRDLYECRACGGRGDQVDHVDGNDSNNALANLQTLCGPCHSRKTAMEQGGFGNKRGARRDEG